MIRWREPRNICVAPAVLTASTMTKRATTSGRTLQLTSRMRRMGLERLWKVAMIATARAAMQVGRPRSNLKAEAEMRMNAVRMIPMKQVRPTGESGMFSVELLQAESSSRWESQRRRK